MKNKHRKQDGFGLIELLVVVVIVGILAAFVLYGLKDKSGNVKKVLKMAEQTIQERKTAAIRLNQANEEGLENREPIRIDFAEPTTTAALRIEGVDANRDGKDDNSGETLTRWNSTTRSWNYAYENKPLTLPDGWTVVTSVDDLFKTSEIPGSELTTSIEFDEKGKPLTMPVYGSGKRKGEEAPFWAIYFKDGDYKRPIVVALAIHGSGLVEQWTYDRDTGTWHGSGGRE